MIRTNPQNNKSRSVTKDAVKSQLKYLKFGIRLWRLREKNKIRSREMAEKLDIPFNEYRRFESGESIPEHNTLQKIAKILKIEFAQLLQWKQSEDKKHGELKPLKGAQKYLYYWDLAEQQFRKHWQINHDPEKKHDIIIREIVNILKKNSCAIKTLPLLPLGTYLILDTLVSDAHNTTNKICDFEDFVIENESLALYIARDPLLGGFLLSAANRVYFTQDPFLNIEDCFNHLSFDQFSDLFFIATSAEGLNSHYENLPDLQEFIEFSSLAVLMVRELKQHLPENINYNHLYLATLLQGLGTYALNTILKPKIESHPDWYKIDQFDAANNTHIKKSLIQHLNWEFHPVISGMIAANWDMPQEVVQALIEHHKQPTHEVSPICAALKLINFFVDCEFPRITGQEASELLAKYPQIKINPKVLLTVAQNMNKKSEHLIEMNSTVLDSTKLADLKPSPQKEIEVIDLACDPICSKPVWRHQHAGKKEFRFDVEYSKILLIDCTRRLLDFINNKTLPKQGESLHNYGERIQNLQLRLHLALTGDLQDVSAKFQLPIEEIVLRLK